MRPARGSDTAFSKSKMIFYFTDYRLQITEKWMLQIAKNRRDRNEEIKKAITVEDYPHICNVGFRNYHKMTIVSFIEADIISNMIQSGAKGVSKEGNAV